MEVPSWAHWTAPPVAVPHLHFIDKLGEAGHPPRLDDVASRMGRELVLASQNGRLELALSAISFDPWSLILSELHAPAMRLTQFGLALLLAMALSGSDSEGEGSSSEASSASTWRVTGRSAFLSEALR